MNDDIDEDKLKEFELSLKDGKFTDKTRKLLSTLTLREAMVLRDRIGVDLKSNQDITEIGKRLETTRQRIREIEEKVLKKLRGRDPDDDDPDAA
jgi:DNA-directed RNA polymerase sigma subunit (sigma70/sigma32)